MILRGADDKTGFRLLVKWSQSFFLWEMVIGESFFFKSACTGAGLTAAVDGNFSFAVKNFDLGGCCAHFAWGKKAFHVGFLFHFPRF